MICFVVVILFVDRCCLLLLRFVLFVVVVIQCTKFDQVWGPEEASDRCTKCGGSRFDADGKPKEWVVHFPLTPRIQSLLQCRRFVETVRWEHDRAQGHNPAYMSGVYTTTKLLHFLYCYKY